MRVTHVAVWQPSILTVHSRRLSGGHADGDPVNQELKDAAVLRVLLGCTRVDPSTHPRAVLDSEEKDRDRCGRS